jgi:hypothetical protein
MMRKPRPRIYQVELSVGRSFCIRLKANSQNHAAIIAEQMLERTGTQGFTPASDIWFSILDAIPMNHGRQRKWCPQRWSYPWKRMGAARRAYQLALEAIDREIRKLHRQHEAKKRRMR